jgi:hypothetical protein
MKTVEKLTFGAEVIFLKVIVSHFQLFEAGTSHFASAT